MESWVTKLVKWIKSTRRAVVRVWKLRVQLNLGYFLNDSNFLMKQHRRQSMLRMSRTPNAVLKRCWVNSSLTRHPRTRRHNYRILKAKWSCLRRRRASLRLKTMKRKSLILVVQLRMRSCVAKQSRSRTRIRTRLSLTLRWLKRWRSKSSQLTSVWWRHLTVLVQDLLQYTMGKMDMYSKTVLESDLE